MSIPEKEELGIIYSITNKLDGKVYYGKSERGEDRWEGHRSFLRGGYHRNSYLQNAWNKYGEDSFEFNVILTCPVSELNQWEMHFIAEAGGCNSDQNYNLTEGGEGGSHSEETKKRISASTSGEKNHNYGKPMSEEQKKKISENHADVSGEKNHMFGKSHTDENKKKISASMSGEKNHQYGKTRTEDWKKAHSIAMSGENHPMFGKKQSEEHKKKRSIALKAYWAKRKQLEAEKKQQSS